MSLRIILALIGILFTVFGLDNGAGGLTSLGVQVRPEGLGPTSPEAMVRDSHVRMLGGLFVCVGLAFIFGAARGRPAYGLLTLLAAFVAVGGIFRLTGPLPAPVWPSAAAEILLMPLLAVWLWRADRKGPVG